MLQRVSEPPERPPATRRMSSGIGVRTVFKRARRPVTYDVNWLEWIMRVLCLLLGVVLTLLAQALLQHA
jgi:hypothetical protein